MNTNIFIDNNNEISHGKPLQEARELTQEEASFYYKGKDCFKVENNKLIDITSSEEYKNKQAQIQKEQNNLEIKTKLDELDRKSIRALRANETLKLAELEAEAVELRLQLQ